MMRLSGLPCAAMSERVAMTFLFYSSTHSDVTDTLEACSERTIGDARKHKEKAFVFTVPYIGDALQRAVMPHDMQCLDKRQYHSPWRDEENEA